MVPLDPSMSFMKVAEAAVVVVAEEVMVVAVAISVDVMVFVTMGVAKVAEEGEDRYLIKINY